MGTHPLLFHVFGMWNIIHDVLPPYRSGNNIVYLFGAQILLSPIENKVIALRAKINRDSLSEENECEDISILMSD